MTALLPEPTAHPRIAVPLQNEAGVEKGANRLKEIQEFGGPGNWRQGIPSRGDPPRHRVRAGIPKAVAVTVESPVIVPMIGEPEIVQGSPSPMMGHRHQIAAEGIADGEVAALDAVDIDSGDIGR